MKDFLSEAMQAAKGQADGKSLGVTFDTACQVQQGVFDFALRFVKSEAETGEDVPHISSTPQDAMRHGPSVQSNLEIATRKPTSRQQP